MSTLVRWEPFRELGALQSELSRLMNGMSEGNGRLAQTWVPALDVWETPTEVVYAFDLPGISEEHISIQVTDETMTVSAEREKIDETSENGGFLALDRRAGVPDRRWTPSRCRARLTTRDVAKVTGQPRGQAQRRLGAYTLSQS